jgi:hypothetical protein
MEKYFEKEFKILTDIGNEYTIRHKEFNKISINDNATQIYLFFRMYSLLNLCVDKMNLNENNKEVEDVFEF